MKNYVSIDIGGTTIKYGVISEDSKILIKNKIDTEAYKGGAEILNKVFKIIESYLEKYNIVGVCISTAGMVDSKKGEILYASSLIPNYTGIKFKEEIEKRYSIPCEVENDVNCAGLAERISGAAINSKVTLCLTIGTGIGGCILIDKDIFHGFSNSACEVGYMKMFDNDFQTLGATSILTKKVSKRKQDLEENWNGYSIFEEAKKGDEICIKAIDEMADIIGLGISNLCYVINPEVVVLGGGIMAQDKYLRPKIDKYLKKYLLPNIYEKTKLEFAKHKNDAGILGAFYNFKNKYL